MQAKVLVFAMYMHRINGGLNQMLLHILHNTLYLIKLDIM